MFDFAYLQTRGNYPPLSSENDPIAIGVNNPYTYNMEKDTIFEGLFIEAVADLVENSEMSHSEFGRAVFGDASGDRLWRAARGERRKRSVTVGEAYVMAEVLGLDLPTLLWRIVQDKKMQGKLP